MSIFNLNKKNSHIKPGAANQLIDWIIDVGIDGIGMLPDAETVAENHRQKTNSVEEAIDSVIAWNTAYAAGTGFITGLGGIATLPVTLPAGMAASYALAVNTAAAIAILRGYDPESEQVKTSILLSLIGKAGIDVIKNTGINIGNKITQGFIKKIPGKMLREINKKVGFRLITKAGEKGTVNLMKIVPVVGGVVGAGFDGAFVNSCGKTARMILK